MRYRLSGAVSCALMGAAIFGTSPASACSSQPREGPPPGKYDLIRENIAGAKLVFTGRVTQVRVLRSDSSNTRYEATIRVSRIYKGMTGPTVFVAGNTSGSLCGAGMLRAGQRLGLLLHEPWEIDSFSRIRYVDLERVTHGRSYRPHTGD